MLKEKLSTTQLHRLGWGWKELGQQREKTAKAICRFTVGMEDVVEKDMAEKLEG